MTLDPFGVVAERKTREANAAPIDRLETIGLVRAWPNAGLIGNDWTRDRYDGAFALAPAPDSRPAVSLVFVQSRNGNTAARDPGTLGGGATDKHLIYEGLSRVAADAVLAGAATVTGGSAFFSVWRRELVALRLELGQPRHPAQVVVSKNGELDVAGTLLFNVPQVPVYVLAAAACRARCGAAFAERPWIRVVPFEGDWRTALATLRREHAVRRISAVGGRRTATSLLDAGVVQDVCLTTTAIDGGEPATPLYAGAHPPAFDVIVEKVTRSETRPIRFQHLAVESISSTTRTRHPTASTGS